MLSNCSKCVDCTNSKIVLQEAANCPIEEPLTFKVGDEILRKLQVPIDALSALLSFDPGKRFRREVHVVPIEETGVLTWNVGGRQSALKPPGNRYGRGPAFSDANALRAGRGFASYANPLLAISTQGKPITWPKSGDLRS